MWSIFRALKGISRRRDRTSQILDPSPMLEEAADWAASKLKSLGYEADFSLESLQEVDRFLANQSSNGEPNPNGCLVENPVRWAFAIGAYVGEVIRQKRGGSWIAPAAGLDAPFDFELHLSGDLIAWPIQRVGKRIRNGEEDSLPIYGSALIKSD
ncbi:hypothetical protein [Microvirga lotononidis]|uniref:hypothetical protein n=1 Tax=Microvirga lotononidis TaxID=864069 RepID=UPI0012B59340|nr:hypothetical protein [Microvirga lotononidis]WQO29323.1 hypothetical protein U0023_09760 [Microvirga lotononidis]